MFDYVISVKVNCREYSAILNLPVNASSIIEAVEYARAAITCCGYEIIDMISCLHYYN